MVKHKSLLRNYSNWKGKVFLLFRSVKGINSSLKNIKLVLDPFLESLCLDTKLWMYFGHFKTHEQKEIMIKTCEELGFIVQTSHKANQIILSLKMFS